MGFDLTKVTFDSSDIPNSHTIGSYITDGTNVVGITANALDVNVAAASGLGIYAEDSAASSGDDGQSVLLVRQDSLAISTSADGDYGNFKSTDKGELYVSDAGSIALLTSIDSDTSAMVVDLAAIEVLLTGIDVDTDNIATSTASIDTKLTSTNSLLTAIDADTSAMVVDLAAIEVLLTSIDGDTSTIAGDTTSIDAILTALSKAEDAAHSSGDQGIMGLAVRNDVEGSLVGADGDYAPLQVDSVGRLRVIGDLDVVGNVADDAADSGNPLKVGSRGVDGLLSALSASNDRADLLSDMYRRIFINDAPNVGNTLSKPTISSTAAEIAATPQAGRTRIIVQNLSNKPIFVGKDNTVTSATGIKIEKNTVMELPYGEDLNLWAISSGVISSDVRVLELG